MRPDGATLDAKAILARLKEIAGPEHSREVLQLVNRLSDLDHDERQFRAARQLRNIGEFVWEYGQAALWKALYIRYALDLSEDGYGLGHWYHEGDEMEFLFHKDWLGPGWTTKRKPACPPTEVRP